jgi:hypothetical protein
MKLRNIILVIKDQMPLKRMFRNFIITRNAWGLFFRNGSHIAGYSGKEKVRYNTKATSLKAAASMNKKTGNHFASYKCLFCDGYHVGKTRKSTTIMLKN